MTRLRRAIAVAAVVAAAGALLGACSDDDDEAKVATTTPTTVATTETLPADPGPTVTGEGAPSGQDGAATPESPAADAGGAGGGGSGDAGGTDDQPPASPGGDAPVDEGQDPGTDALPRTSEACGSQVIVESDGYTEGRADAEQGLPFQVDHGPPPGPDDLDGDPITVGPADRYQAGYSQGWCEGGGAGAPDDSGGSTTN